MNIETFIGVDVSKSWLDIAVSNKRNVSILKFKCDNNANGFKSFVKALRENNLAVGKKVLITLEHTGNYNGAFVKTFSKKNCLICLESALRIKKSLGLHRGKNDVIDAERILNYSIKNKEHLNLWKEPRKSITLLKDLLTNRERLLRFSGALQVPIKEIKSKYTHYEWLKIKRINQAGVDGINSSIEKIEKEINSIVKSDKNINRQVDLLKSVPGIGLIIALNLICRTNEFNNYKTGKQLACLAGVAPFAYSSGTLVGKGHVSHYANKTLKRCIHIGAVSTTRMKNSELGLYYARKVAEGKNKMLVINNIRNKILCRAAAVIRRGEPYKMQKGRLKPEREIN